MQTTKKTAASPDPYASATRNNTYFVPRDGIDREVITADICRYLGNDALVRPDSMMNDEGRLVHGYTITAYRNLTTAMIDSLKDDSRKWQDEKRRAQSGQGTSGGPQMRYSDYANRLPNSPPSNMYSSRDHYPDTRTPMSDPNNTQSAYYSGQPGGYGSGYPPPGGYEHSGHPAHPAHSGHPSHYPPTNRYPPQSGYPEPAAVPYVNSVPYSSAANIQTTGYPGDTAMGGMTNAYPPTTQSPYSAVPAPYYQPHPSAPAAQPGMAYDPPAQARDVFHGRGGYTNPAPAAGYPATTGANMPTDYVMSPAGSNPQSAGAAAAYAGYGTSGMDPSQQYEDVPRSTAKSSVISPASTSSTLAQTSNSGTSVASGPSAAARRPERERDPLSRERERERERDRDREREHRDRDHRDHPDSRKHSYYTSAPRR